MHSAHWSLSKHLGYLSDSRGIRVLMFKSSLFYLVATGVITATLALLSVLIFKLSLFYLPRAPKHESGDAGNSDMP